MAFMEWSRMNRCNYHKILIENGQCKEETAAIHFPLIQRNKDTIMRCSMQIHMNEIKRMAIKHGLFKCPIVAITLEQCMHHIRQDFYILRATNEILIDLIAVKIIGIQSVLTLRPLSS